MFSHIAAMSVILQAVQNSTFEINHGNTGYTEKWQEGGACR